MNVFSGIDCNSLFFLRLRYNPAENQFCLIHCSSLYFIFRDSFQLWNIFLLFYINFAHVVVAEIFIKTTHHVAEIFFKSHLPASYSLKRLKQWSSSCFNKKLPECRSPDLFNRMCKEYPFLLIKIIRVRLHVLQDLLQQNAWATCVTRTNNKQGITFDWWHSFRTIYILERQCPMRIYVTY